MNSGAAGVFAELAPFRIEPKFVARVWGSNDLNPWYPFTSSSGLVGEVWLTGDECKVASGPHAGRPLAELFRDAPLAMLGSGVSAAGSPLLIKMIFAREKLSVQVHPDDALAQKYGYPRGKTECWYALAAEAGAKVALGLRQGTTLEQVKAAIHNGTMENCLNIVSIAAGEMVFVDAGTVHAIWPGSVLLETQQNCDLTYRLYDYGRPRELQIEESLEAIRLTTRAAKVLARSGADRTVLLEDDYFCIERVPVNVSRPSTSLPGRAELLRGLSYLFAAAGSARLTSPGFEAVALPERGIVAVPAMSPIFAVQDTGGLDLIRISPRWPGGAS